MKINELINETVSTGLGGGSAGNSGGPMVGGPTTYEQEYNMFKRKGNKRVTAMTNEFAPPGGGDDEEPDEYEILHKLASQWWNGTEQQMIKAQKTLEAMGWEIGEDEGYDQGGVFVVRANDEHGKSYISWPHEDLNLTEAYQYDESNLMYRYDTSKGRLVQAMIHNRNDASARQQGYRDTQEQALRVHGIMRSKFDPKKYVQNQNGKWVTVYPYGKQDVEEGKNEWSRNNPPPPDLLLNTLIQILTNPNNKKSPKELIDLWNKTYGLRYTLRTLRQYAQNDYKKAELDKALSRVMAHESFKGQ